MFKIGNNEIGYSIRKLRKKEGMTLTEIAKKVGVSQPFLSTIENGKNIPTIDLLFKIIEVLAIHKVTKTDLYWTEPSYETKKEIVDTCITIFENYFLDKLGTKIGTDWTPSRILNSKEEKIFNMMDFYVESEKNNDNLLNTSLPTEFIKNLEANIIESTRDTDTIDLNQLIDKFKCSLDFSFLFESHLSDNIDFFFNGKKMSDVEKNIIKGFIFGLMKQE